MQSLRFPSGDIPLIGKRPTVQPGCADIQGLRAGNPGHPVLQQNIKGNGLAAIGENPRAADSAGIPVHRYQWAAVLLKRYAGRTGREHIWFWVQVGNFSENMTSGRGYIALAAVILGRYVPFGMMGAAFIFGAANALQIRLQAIGVPLPHTGSGYAALHHNPGCPFGRHRQKQRAGGIGQAVYQGSLQVGGLSPVHFICWLHSNPMSCKHVLGLLLCFNEAPELKTSRESPFSMFDSSFIRPSMPGEVDDEVTIIGIDNQGGL